MSVGKTTVCWVALLVVAVGFIAGCGSRMEDQPIGKPVAIHPPLGLPPLPASPLNPPTEETIQLGRVLFYDRRLSGDDSMACASCHNPTLAFTDRLPHSRGVGGKLGVRNAPTVINAAYYPLQFWDGRAATLEEQAASPIANPIEMDQTHDVCVSKLESQQPYKGLFEKAYGPGPVTMGKIQNALASFERTLLSADSPFDRYQYAGDKAALSPAAIRGLAIFKDPKKGDCVSCHTIEGKYALFTDGKFHNIGVGVNGAGELTDLGRFEQTRVEADKGAFKTPSLRNVTQTGPYMHDGSQKTLKEVVDFYAGGGNSNPYLDSKIKSIELSGADRSDLVEFLKSLTGKAPQGVGPPLVAKTDTPK